MREKGPQSLVQRIEVVDEDRKTINRVKRYLKPIWDEVGYNSSGSNNVDAYLSKTRQIGIHTYTMRRERCYLFAEDFLYKLALASRYRAMADIHDSISLGLIMRSLGGELLDEESKFRLDQLIGLYNIYGKPQTIDALTMLPKVNSPAISERVDDLLQSAEIIELSRDRHLLGIPSKIKIAMKRIRKRVKRILRDERLSKELSAATDLIQIIGANASLLKMGASLPSGEVCRILNALQKSEYNPPLINLDRFRMQIAKEVALPKRYPMYVIPYGNSLLTFYEPVVRARAKKEEDLEQLKPSQLSQFSFA
ncbi:hypothetical protein MUP77_02655 [Candidatus Bathyarchaeota archaeon]|nr:hypothetical protein [Candidatus Bathyarchaeota archaeon]